MQSFQVLDVTSKTREHYSASLLNLSCRLHEILTVMWQAQTADRCDLLLSSIFLWWSYSQWTLNFPQRKGSFKWDRRRGKYTRNRKESKDQVSQNRGTSEVQGESGQWVLPCRKTQQDEDCTSARCVCAWGVPGDGRRSRFSRQGAKRASLDCAKGKGGREDRTLERALRVCVCEWVTGVCESEVYVTVCQCVCDISNGRQLRMVACREVF